MTKTGIASLKPRACEKGWIEYRAKLYSHIVKGDPEVLMNVPPGTNTYK